jgi:hypothetical protein
LAELENTDNFMLCELLRELGTTPITGIRDKKGLSLLHHAVLKGVDGKVQLLLDFARNY